DVVRGSRGRRPARRYRQMVASYAAIGMERTALVVEAAAESDPALMAVLAHWGFTVVHTEGSRDALAQMAAQSPALLVVPDGGSITTGRCVATVARRGSETGRRRARPPDVVLQRPVDPAELEGLLETMFGPATRAVPLPKDRSTTAAA